MSKFPKRNLPLNAAITGATTLLASAASTHAAVLHYDSNISVSNTATDTLYLNIDAGLAATAATGLGDDELRFTVSSTTDPGGASKPVVTVQGLSASLISGVTASAPFSNSATKYQPGNAIATPDLASAELAGFLNTAWSPGTGPGYLGFSFQPGTTPLFGWAQFDLTEDIGDPAVLADSIYTLKLIDFAYEDSGATLTAGAIPEPSSAAMLAAALAGSATLFRRRQATQAVA